MLLPALLSSSGCCACRQGIIPLDVTSDTAGPIARSVTDVALLLGAMVGYDQADNLTALAQTNVPPDNYVQFLQPGLKVAPPTPLGAS